MHGQRPSHRPGGGGRGTAQPPQQQQRQIHPSSNYFIKPDLLLLQQNPNFFPYVNPFIQNPNNFPPVQQQFPTNNFVNPVNPRNHNFPANNNRIFPQQQAKVQNDMIEKLDKAAKKVRRDLIASKESVSSWRVSQTALLAVKAESWESLGFQMQQVPSLNQLLVTEGKINSFIHCFVAVRRITSLHDLEVAVCESEGVERFDDLELGPLARHPLAVHYFSVASDMNEVYRIRTEQIIFYLCEFLDTQKKKDVNVDAFLDFMAMKQSVTCREKLCVRVQNFGQYIKYIRQARQSEDTVLRQCFEKVRNRTSKTRDRRARKRLFSFAQKKQLDEHFSSMSQRVKSFSSETKQFCGKHVLFPSSGSEDDDNEDNDDEGNKEAKNTPASCSLPLPNVTSDCASSCPYPSATEEIKRLGLKSEVNCSPYTPNVGACSDDTDFSQGKRKCESMITSPTKLLKRDKFDRYPMHKGSGNQRINDHSLTRESLGTFVTTWKEACRGNNADEVLERMLQFYNTRSKKKVKDLFLSYPFVGLLNVAVTSIKSGTWDNMYEAFQDFSQRDVDDKAFENSADFITIDVEPDKGIVSASSQQKILSQTHGVTVEDIAHKISKYFEDEACCNKSDLRESRILFLRNLCKCEYWLLEQYSIKEFDTLGYGEYFMFLQKYMHLLPHALQVFLMGDIREKVSLEAHLLPLQLDLLISQSLNGLWENERINEQNISELLVRQFPLVCLKLVKTDPTTDFADLLQEQKCKLASSCVLFSAPLLRLCCEADSLTQADKRMREISGFDTNNGAREGIIGTVEVFLRAPMLTDLKLWSHWDTLYAPSLGSIVEWLLNEVNTKEFLCLVTKEGKVIRIDHSATTDSFFKVIIEGSAFETAVKLLSLFTLYGGDRNVPLSLLKCHAREAFELIVNNSKEMELDDDKNPLMRGKSFWASHIAAGNRSSNASSNFPYERSMLNKDITIMSRFVLDCLGYLPIEFCSYATDILVSGLQSLFKDVPLAILSECRHIGERLMLHEVGLSLGLVEWVNDHHSLHSSATSGLSPKGSCLDVVNSEVNTRSMILQDALNTHSSSSGEMLVCRKADCHDVNCKHVSNKSDLAEVSVYSQTANSEQLSVLDNLTDSDPARVIESIRQEEFGLDNSLSAAKNILLEKQHARLGRALHCLSQELYSQDSHFLLELVQNADDNDYPEDVEPTLTFILQEKDIIVLNNERGFSANNIRALCDVGNSTKKGLNAGYIGKKGIGFKSVFRVTDAPEIHSNGFHIKFDITEGQIGFVLPTTIPPCDIELYTRLQSTDVDCANRNAWNTCIVLPFRSSLSKAFTMNNILSMFSDLHPSLLLFLHRLQCIKFRNMLDGSLLVMRKEVAGDGIIQVSLGSEKMTWFVASKKLQADVIRSDVRTTEISIAFTLREAEDGGYTPILNQQPVFAFLPLRTYGLKFILQGDFVLPSSREEVDGNSPWNQWLLSEFPDLFVSAEMSFCNLPCYRENPGKAITVYMSYIPLVGEVHGFFSSLPRIIVSKLRMSNCMLLEGEEQKWIPPCNVLRNWTKEARSLLPESLLHKHLGLGFLNKDVVLSDSLARALGIEDYGPNILLKVISSLCSTDIGLNSVGLSWLSSWLSGMYRMLAHSFIQASPCFGTESDFISKLQKMPFIPLSDGKYSSVDKGTIWLHSDAGNHGINEESVLIAFPKLYAKLRTINPALLAAAASIENTCSDKAILENVRMMLYKVGVQRLSAHEILKMHILPAISDDTNLMGQEDLMIEYLSFAMFHLQSSCMACSLEKGGIIEELRNRALILTNYGYKRFYDVPIHFSREYGSSIDVNKVVSGLEVKWHEIDTAYIKHPITKSVSEGVVKWRIFFQEIGVTDFVQIIQVEKRVADMSLVNIKDMMLGNVIMSMNAVAKNWESEELSNLLSLLSVSNDGDKSKYLLEIFDTLWDGHFSNKITGCCVDATGECTPFKSSFITILQDVPWIYSNFDHKLHYPRDLFHDCAAVNSILGACAPYTVPKVKSAKFITDIGLKTQATLDDALSVLRVWRSISSFKASVSQMSNFYAFLFKGMTVSKEKITDELLSGSFIFVPYEAACSNEDIVAGVLLSPQEVYWHDATGTMDQMKYVIPECTLGSADIPLRQMLCNFYPSLHDFFVYECGVDESPPFCSYLQILLQLSTTALPLQAAKRVYEVFVRWSDALESGSLSLEDVQYLKECLLKKEYTVLPTAQDKWVSLHASFGLICWSDDDNLGREFKHLEGVDFLYFGEFTDEENQKIGAKISNIMQGLGIPALSQIVTREAIYYGPADTTFISSLLDWVLPFAQRYIYNTHSDKYVQLKQSDFKMITHLKIVVVEKLFFRNVIRRYDITSKKRHECTCLLQDNILYCSQESDPHSIFLEFSRLLFDGTSELNFANFLHMITTMAESGATEEQTEFFILNSQKVPKLPVEEPCWSLQSSSPLAENDTLSTDNGSSLKVQEQYFSVFKKRQGINPSWPPADWKTAPGFCSSRAFGLKTPAAIPFQVTEGNSAKEILEQADITSTEISCELNMESDPLVITPGAVSPVAEIPETKPNLSGDWVASGLNLALDSVNLVAPDCKISIPSSGTGEREELFAQQAKLTGRLGESVAFKYFVEKEVGNMSVRWVNEANETGLPYDITIGSDANIREYIEVKATKVARKNWFFISMREWQFAIEKGESFSIAHVILSDDNMAKVIVYKNPARLCQLGNMRLALVVPKP